MGLPLTFARALSSFSWDLAPAGSLPPLATPFVSLGVSGGSGTLNV